MAASQASNQKERFSRQKRGLTGQGRAPTPGAAPVMIVLRRPPRWPAVRPSRVVDRIVVRSTAGAPTSFPNRLIFQNCLGWLKKAWRSRTRRRKAAVGVSREVVQPMQHQAWLKTSWPQT